jgi:hypothetical protein
MKTKIKQYWSTIFTNINKTNNHLARKTIEHKQKHDIWCWKSMAWQ